MKRVMQKLGLGLLTSVALVGWAAPSAEAQFNHGGRYCPPVVAYRPVVVVPSYGTSLSVNRVTPFGYGIQYGHTSFRPAVPVYSGFGYSGFGVGPSLGVPRGASWGGGAFPPGASWGGGAFPPGASWGGVNAGRSTLFSY